MQDIILKGISNDSNIKFTAVDCSNLVKKILEIHKTPKVITQLLGQLSVAALMMGSDLKNGDDLLTVQINSEGIIKNMIVTSSNDNKVKCCYAINKDIEDVSPGFRVKDLLNNGRINVIRDTGLGKPYNGIIPLTYYDLAQDISYYYLTSEQTPTALGLGVLFIDDVLKKAGGFLVQPMSDCSEGVISTLESNLKKMPHLTDLLDLGHGIRDIVKKFILKGIYYKYSSEGYPEYFCNCSRARFLRGLNFLSKDDINDVFKDQAVVEIECQFCVKKYKFELKEFI